jgi:hypothetical protein
MTTVTVLVACYLLVSFMSEYNVPKSGMRVLWDYITVMLGENCHKLPTFKQALETVGQYGGMRTETYDACVKDCVLFRDRPPEHDPKGEHRFAHLRSCPKCGAARYNKRGRARRRFSWLGVNRQLSARLWFPGPSTIS